MDTILSDHVGRNDLRVLASGTVVALVDGRVARVLCSEIVMVATEDGPMDGRCKGPVEMGDILACRGHASQIRGWRAQSELETVAWEQELERTR